MTETLHKHVTGSQRRLLGEIFSTVAELPDAPVKKVIQGSHFLAVISSRMGICSNMQRHCQDISKEDRRIPESTREVASFLLQPSPDFPDAPAYALAANNSLLPIPQDTVSLKAQDLIRKRGEGKNVAVIGHFPFVDNMGGEFCKLWVLETHPKKGDLGAEAAAELLPQADVIAFTATTLLNGTCADILNLIPKGAFTIMLGPSTPFAPCLFDWGINALAGCHVRDTSLATSCVREGLPFKPSMGVEPLIWIRDRNSLSTRELS